MKRIALAILVTLLVAGLAGVVDAQQQPGAGATPPSGSSASPSGSAPAPGGDSKSTNIDVNVGRSPGAPSGTEAPRSPDVKIDSKTEVRSGDRDGGSALPRAAASDRTTIFGLSPTAAVIIAAALLVVVILAIVAMTRSGPGYIDTDRRV
ncbi:MAG TPA: hypothetical protein VNN07_03035 [Candidatus Tectomicrobia bacterium]|nr:hypothetical protein [Candidatus Tectomicrobia bacterium]